MSLHIHYDHRCVNCGAVYIPYDRDVPCPQCEGVEGDRFYDFIPQAVASAEYNLKNEGKYMPTAWFVGSLGDHILSLCFRVLDAHRTDPQQRSFERVLVERLPRFDWGDQPYAERHLRGILRRVYGGLSSSRNPIDVLLPIIDDSSYADGTPDTWPAEFPLVFTSAEFMRLKWGLKYPALAVAFNILKQTDRDSFCQQLITRFKDSLAAHRDTTLVTVGEFVVVTVELAAVKVSSDRVQKTMFQPLTTGRVRIDELGRIICNARLQGLLDCLRQGLAAEVEPESYLDVLAHPLWRGLPQLAACFVVCVCGTALIRDLQVSSPHAVRKVSMTGSVLQAMCDDMDSALS